MRLIVDYSLSLISMMSYIIIYYSIPPSMSIWLLIQSFEFHRPWCEFRSSRTSLPLPWICRYPKTALLSIPLSSSIIHGKIGNYVSHRRFLRILVSAILFISSFMSCPMTFQLLYSYSRCHSVHLLWRNCYLRFLIHSFVHLYMRKL